MWLGPVCRTGSPAFKQAAGGTCGQSPILQGDCRQQAAGVGRRPSTMLTPFVLTRFCRVLRCLTLISGR